MENNYTSYSRGHGEEDGSLADSTSGAQDRAGGSSSGGADGRTGRAHESRPCDRGVLGGTPGVRPDELADGGVTKSEARADRLRRGRTSVYWLHDDRDVLLYVGVARDPRLRWKQHASSQPWWRDVHTRTVEWFDDRDAALEVEQRSIKRDLPLHNERGALVASIDQIDGMPRVGLGHAKKALGALVDKAAAGEGCVILRNGRPVAALVAVPSLSSAPGKDA